MPISVSPAAMTSHTSNPWEPSKSISSDAEQPPTPDQKASLSRSLRPSPAWLSSFRFLLHSRRPGVRALGRALRELGAAKGDQPANDTSKLILVGAGIALGIFLVGAVGWAWYHRSSRYMPA